MREGFLRITRIVSHKEKSGGIGMAQAHDQYLYFNGHMTGAIQGDSPIRMDFLHKMLDLLNSPDVIEAREGASTAIDLVDLCLESGQFQ